MPQAVHQPDRQRLFTREQIGAKHYVERRLYARQPHAALGPPGARQQAKPDFRQPQTRVGQCQPIVGRHCQLQPAAKCVASNGRHHQLIAGFQLVAEIAQCGRLARLAKFPNVGTCRKVVAAPQQQQRRNFIIVIQL